MEVVISLIIIVFLIYIIFFHDFEFLDKYTPAPVIEKPTDRDYDQDFRREGDDQHVIRIKQKPPSNFKKFKEYVSVSGVSKAGRKQSVSEFIKGGKREVNLERDPENEYDPNAVKVIGTWTNNLDSKKTKQLGWLPSEVADELAREEAEDIPIDATLKTMFKPQKNKNPGLRIDIWVPQKNSKLREG